MRAWEPEEDRLIIELLAKLGPRWSKISKMLPNRTISSIRNRWQRIDKGRKLRDEGKLSKNRCNVCGQPKRGHVCFERIRQQAAAKHEEEEASLQAAWERCGGGCTCGLGEGCPMKGLQRCEHCGDIKKMACRKRVCIEKAAPLLITYNGAAALPAPVEAAPVEAAAAPAAAI